MENLKQLAETRDYYQELLDIEIRKLGNGCPFDPIAKCNLVPGDSCAEIDCPVWLQNGDRVESPNT